MKFLKVLPMLINSKLNATVIGNCLTALNSGFISLNLIFRETISKREK